MIIIGANGYLGSYLAEKYINSIIIIKDNYSEFIINWNNNNYNNEIVLICVSNDYIINDLLLNSNNNNTFILSSSAVIYNNINKELYNEKEIINENINDNNYVKLIKQNEKNLLKLKGKKIILRMGTLYGYSPYLNASRGINKMLLSLLINNSIIIDNCTLRKSMLWLGDIYNAINILLKNKKIKNLNDQIEIYNISSFNTTIDHVSKSISNKYDIPLEYSSKTNTVNYDFHLDTTKLENLGWIPTKNINYDDFINNIHNCKEIKYDNDIIWYVKNTCRICNSSDLINIIDLGKQPPPNRLNDKLWEYINFPLKLNCCTKCYHLQLYGVINPKIMYRNYTYLSGTSNTMKEYFKYFVESIILSNKTNIENKNILDIAWNDGSLLDAFLEKEFNTFGIGPAYNIVNNIKNHNIICDFFNSTSIKCYNIKFDIITLFNVFAHIDNIYELLDNIDKITNLDSDIYIQTSQCNMIQNNEFDTISHEHLSFFNINSMSLISNYTNFYLFDVKIVNVHGSSYLFHLKKNNKCITSNVLQQFNYEINTNIYNLDTYAKYSNYINCIWKNKLYKLLNNKIIGVGASAKGITILNYIYKDLLEKNIIIDCIIDENELKIGKKINSINITINNFEYIKNINENINFILFAWNYKTEIINKVKNLRLNYNDNFIDLFPEPIVL
jgi:hypothetical protein